jgi:DNA-binding response OmpR family regulator
MTKHVLIVSGQSSDGDTMAAVTRYRGLEPVVYATARSAKDLLAAKHLAAILCEDTLPDGSFRDVIVDTARLASCTPVIVVSRRDDWESYAIVLSAGASDYLAFPRHLGEVQQALERTHKLSREFATAA